MEIRRGDYTARDVANIRAHTLAELQRRFPGITFDLAETASSIENVMMTPSFFGQDALSLYQDAMFSEAYLDTLAEKANAQSKAKAEGFPISRREAALAELTYTYTKDNPAAPDLIVIPQGTALSIPGSSVRWTVIEPTTVVLAGGTFPAYQGQFVTDVFTATAGVPDQVFTLSRRNVAGNVGVSANIAAVDWNEVEQVSRAGAADAFQVEWFGDRVRIRTGDGANGNIPAGVVSVTYFVTNGSAGSAAAGAVAGQHKQSSVTVSFSNLAAAAGSDGDSVADLKRYLPGWSRSQDRLVTTDDYVQALEKHPGIMYAAMEFSQRLQKKVFFIMATGYSAPSQSLLDEVTEAFRGKNQEHVLHEYRAVTQVGAVISMKVKLSSGVSKSALITKRQEIHDELTQMFYPTVRTEVYNNAVGRSVRLSDAYRVVESVKNVEYLDMRSFTRQPALQSEDWDSGADDVALADWQVTSSQYGVAGSGTSSISGLDPKQRESSFKGSVFEVTLTPSRRRWASWPTTGSMALTLDRAFRRSRVSTAHFQVVTRYLDGSTSPMVTSSYVGKDTTAGFGFFTFRLDATKFDVVIDSPSPYYVDGLPVFRSAHGKLCVGSVSGTVSDPDTGVNEAFTDDSNGGLLNVDLTRIGYIDYDTGTLMFLAPGYANLVGTAQNYDFDNKISQRAEIVVSPPVGDILVRPNEFCGIYALQMEVTT